VPAEPLTLPPMPASFAAVAALFTERREGLIAVALRTQVRLVSFAAGRIEWRQPETTPGDLAPRVARLLGEWTGRRWTVAVNAVDPAQPTLVEQEAGAEARRRQDAAAQPLVQAILSVFPDAVIEAVRDRADAASAEPDAPETGGDFDVELFPGEEDL
jgi:DNA polymerase-3 subunit gamma/tau